jgi:ABC-type transport system substrate-binding protein
VTGLRPAIASLVALAAFCAAGCGSSGQEVAGAVGPVTARGELSVALPALPHDLDPLTAPSHAAELISRQLFEPLVEDLAGPYGDVRRVSGLAVGIRPSADRDTWRLRLRTGVRFQDGTLMSADSVLANVERWRTTAAGEALLPGLVAADSPRPDFVRLFFDRPVPDLPQRLASPRLGIVAPEALDPPSGTDATVSRVAEAGTGPFELRQRGARRILLVRNMEWWGARHQLGPALDEVAFRAVPSAAGRLVLLRQGEVQAAAGLPPALGRRASRDPLLVVLPKSAGGELAVERSVRGIDSATQVPSLSAAWLTRIGAG